MKIVNEILEKMLNASEVDSPEWERISEAFEEIEGIKRHIEAIKIQQEATSKALYQLQFFTHEKLIQRYIKLKEFVKNSGLIIPDDLK